LFFCAFGAFIHFFSLGGVFFVVWVFCVFFPFFFRFLGGVLLDLCVLCAAGGFTKTGP